MLVYVRKDKVEQIFLPTDIGMIPSWISQKEKDDEMLKR